MKREVVQEQAIAAMYRAAAGVQSWSDALRVMSRAVDAWQVCLYAIDRVESRLDLSLGAGSAPEQWLEAFTALAARHPLVRPATGVDAPGALRRLEDPLASFLGLPPAMVRDTLLPSGPGGVFGGCLHEDARRSVFWLVLKRPGLAPWGLDEQSALARVGAHLHEAMALFMTRPPLPVGATVEGEVLRSLPIAALLIDGQGRVRARNPEAQGLIDDGQGVSESGGRLALIQRPDGHDRLPDLLRSLGLRPLSPATPLRTPDALARYPSQGAARRTSFLRIARGHELPPLGVHAWMLQSPMLPGGQRVEPLALVMLHDPRRVMSLDPGLVASSFDLTPAQARVAAALAEGLSAAEIASEHAVSLNTVRSQIQSVMGKLGVRRQAEVVATLARLPALWAPAGATTQVAAGV